jgi:hypothetical protein
VQLQRCVARAAVVPSVFSFAPQHTAAVRNGSTHADPRPACSGSVQWPLLAVGEQCWRLATRPRGVLQVQADCVSVKWLTAAHTRVYSCAGWTAAGMCSGQRQLAGLRRGCLCSRLWPDGTWWDQGCGCLCAASPDHVVSLAGIMLAACQQGPCSPCSSTLRAAHVCNVGSQSWQVCSAGSTE